MVTMNAGSSTNQKRSIGAAIVALAAALSLADGLRQDSASRPSQPYPATDDMRAESGSAAPFAHAQALSIVFEKQGRPLVVGLVDSRRPSAVLGRVRAVVADALDGMSRRWARPHVGVEGRESLPSGVDRDTASTVAGVTDCVRVQAAFPDASPDGVFGSASHPVRGSMLRVQFGAPATLGASVNQIQGQHVAHRAARANAGPSRVSVDAAVSGANDETAERLSGEIGS